MKNPEPISSIVKRYRSIYEKFSPVYAPALDEKVYFNAAGFKHLIFKGKHRRKNTVIYSRMILVPLIIPVIKNCREEVEMRIREENIDGYPVMVTYRALEARVGNGAARVRVVVRKHGRRGKYYFQSVMKYN